MSSGEDEQGGRGDCGVWYGSCYAGAGGCMGVRAGVHAGFIFLEHYNLV